MRVFYKQLEGLSHNSNDTESEPISRRALTNSEAPLLDVTKRIAADNTPLAQIDSCDVQTDNVSPIMQFLCFVY